MPALKVEKDFDEHFIPMIMTRAFGTTEHQYEARSRKALRKKMIDYLAYRFAPAYKFLVLHSTGAAIRLGAF